VHGPVSGVVTVAGKPYAIALDRSTRGRDVTVARFFEALNSNRVRSAKDFIADAATMEMTFNWFYADNRDIAYFSSGRVPIRAPGPAHGTGPRRAQCAGRGPRGPVGESGCQPARSRRRREDRRAWRGCARRGVRAAGEGRAAAGARGPDDGSRPLPQGRRHPQR